jgi:hypothetical protein
MARKKPAKKAKKKSAAKPSARKSAKKTSKKAPKKVAKKAAKKAVTKKAKPAARKAAPRKAAPKKTAPKKAAAKVASKKPNLDRPRKTVADIHGIPSSLDMNRAPSAAKSGRADMKEKLARNTSGGAAITAGDVDADWQSGEAIGDESPGGDNPTPDQDVVDDIGRALGVEYEDDEELQGGDEIAERDRNRWELDPSSKDDFEDTE